jgi:hypothetical protein
MIPLRMIRIIMFLTIEINRKTLIIYPSIILYRNPFIKITLILFKDILKRCKSRNSNLFMFLQKLKAIFKIAKY